MILIDANLLIYAVNLDSHHHRRARGWLEETLSGATSVGLPWICLLAFLRITTRPGILARPLKSDEATGFVETWLDQPFVDPVVPGLLQDASTGGRPASDTRALNAPRSWSRRVFRRSSLSSIRAMYSSASARA